jgi:serine O-acetyltransferase
MKKVLRDCPLAHRKGKNDGQSCACWKLHPHWLSFCANDFPEPFSKKGSNDGMLTDDLSPIFMQMKGSVWSKSVRLFGAPGTRAIIIFRFGSWLLTRPLIVRFFLKPIKVILQRRIMSKWGIAIDDKARIGPGFRIAHFGGIFIGEHVVAGTNFVISHDVTLGASGGGTRRGAPVIGDNVYIAPGAKVVGKITIGNNVKIGANAVVERDVPDNALVQMRSPQVVVFSVYDKGAKVEKKVDGPQAPDPGNSPQIQENH